MTVWFRLCKRVLRGSVLITLVCASLTASSPAQPAREQFFPFSVWYGGGKARAPMLEPIDESSRRRWTQDLQQIKELGFNTVRTWVEWTACEARPGEYNLDHLKLLAGIAEELGLKVLVQVYVDSAPDWVGEEFADARFVAQSGEVIPSQAAPGYCFDHPEVRKKILDFYLEVARVATRYPNFVGWDLWSEPHVINWAIIDYVPNATFCYCPSSQQRFRGWLREKYGSLSELNRAWYRTFTDWEQVEPPRFGTILSYTDFIDWRRFIQQKLAQDLGLRAEAVRSVDPDPVVTSHAAVPCLFTSPLWGVGAPDDWLMADQVDYWGTSIYPKHSFPDRHWSRLRLSVLMDFARSAGKGNDGFYVGELQAGMGVRGTVVGDPVTSDDHRLWVWGLLSRGARGINVYAYYPMSSGYEAGGYGLINLDGGLTPRGRDMGRLARLVDRNRALFLNSVPQRADVAIVYNPLSFLVGGHQQMGDPAAVRDSLTGLYRAFWRQNFAVDFVHLREVEEGGLGRYKLAFLPYPLMLTERSARSLKVFVEQGGTLVAEARCGWNDDRGFAQETIPGFGLQEVFGVREGRLRMGEEIEIRVGSGDPAPGGLRRGQTLTGRGIQEELLPEPGVERLATFSDGSAAVTRKSYGRGRAVFIGSFLGLANGKERNENTEAFLLSLARGQGIGPVVEAEVEPAGALVEVRRTSAEGSSILYLFNHSEQDVAVRLPLGWGLNLETGEREDLSRLLLGAGQVKVYRIETE